MAGFTQLNAVAAKWEAEFTRQKSHYGSKIQCRLGCTDCCHHLFRITELEAAYVSKGGKELKLRGYIGPFYRTQVWIRVE